MSRVQLALNVTNLEASIDFYSKLFGTPPAKVREGYANFAIAEPPLKLVLIEHATDGGSINHLGVEVEGTDLVAATTARLSGEGLATDVEEETTCCFAVQDKVWVTAPDDERWEVYTVLADAETWGAEPEAEPGCCSAAAEPVTLSAPAPRACC